VPSIPGWSSERVNMDVILKVLGAIGLSIVSAAVGYLVGVAKSRREQKQKAYAEILPPIAEMVYRGREANIRAYNQALMKLWLYASRRVTDNLDVPLHTIHGSRPGDREEALKEIIVAFRSDVQIWPHWPLRPLTVKDIHHLFTNPENRPT